MCAERESPRLEGSWEPVEESSRELLQEGPAPQEKAAK